MEQGRAKYYVWLYPGLIRYMELAATLLERGSGYETQPGPYFIPVPLEARDQFVPGEFFIVISTGPPLSETYSHVEEQEETPPAEVVPTRSHTPEFSEYSDGEKPHIYNFACMQSYIEPLCLLVCTFTEEEEQEGEEEE